MRFSSLSLYVLALGVLVAACAPAPTATPLVVPATAAPTAQPISVPALSAQEQAAQLGRGINFGNALEAPNEGEWGLTLEERYFDLVQAGGFQTIRLPTRWSAHALAEAPYTIDPTFFARIDWAIENALRRNLNIIINVHHYEEIMAAPDAHTERFQAIWAQIAERYQNQPPAVLFELLNEPNGEQMTAERWNTLAAETLAVVRRTNPTRNIIVGGIDWNSVYSLEKLRLPVDDQHLIGTFHYYAPFEFTHQGAEWVDGAEAWLGTQWVVNETTIADVAWDFEIAKQWAANTNRPVWLGEFGAYSKADMASRAEWTRYIARAAEQRNIHWAYWEFGSGFGVYNLAQDVWIEDLLKALVP